jgi:threonine dehydrogenase-like Zn-dependent dehydrogenase
MSLPRTTMAMVQTGVKKLEAQNLAIPDIDDDSAILRVEACGICGSDYEQFNGQLGTPIPAIPGHEPLGIIERIGDRAAKKWGVDVGDRVAVETMISCHYCSCCLTGRYHLCSDRKIYSYIPLKDQHGLWGAYSEYMFIDSRSILHKVSKDVAPELAVIFNPLGAGFRWGVEIPETKPGDTVVIMGPGQRGLSCVIACKQAGAKNIIVTGLQADHAKLEVAKIFGANHVIDVENENASSKIQQYTNGGADVVIDVTSYATKPVQEALNYVKPGGTIVLAGIKGFKPIENWISDWIVLKEITIKGAIGVTSTGYANAIRVIEEGQVPIEKMHTHNFALADAELAIKTLAREIPGDESIHSCLLPNR